MLTIKVRWKYTIFYYTKHTISASCANLLIFFKESLFQYLNITHHPFNANKRSTYRIDNIIDGCLMKSEWDGITYPSNTSRFYPMSCRSIHQIVALPVHHDAADTAQQRKGLVP